MSILLPGRNLVLVGMPGSGKTTVGALLAERLRRPFVDTDHLVEQELGRTVPAIFDELGEEAFRDAEAEVIRRVSALRGQVVAVGGGALATQGSLTHLRMTGDIVLLDATTEELADRLGAGKATAGVGEGGPGEGGAGDSANRLAHLRAARDAGYRRAAAHVVDTSGRAPEEVADEVAEWARTRPGLLSRSEVTRL